MAASDEERELIVQGLLAVEVDVSRLRAGRDDGCGICGQHREAILESPCSADLVDGLASAGRDQPGARSVGDSIGGPSCRRLDERVLCRVFRDGEVADVAHERGHQPWPLGAKDVGDTHQIRQLSEPMARQLSNSMTGRTSIVPK